MRKIALAVAFFTTACALQSPPASVPADVEVLQRNRVVTADEEAWVLLMEDRREFDPAVLARFVADPSATHRQRIAVAIGRLGGQSFVDTNGNNERDAGEEVAGASELRTLAADPDRQVRETVAFALGEIADAATLDTLLQLTRDEDALVASEAVEALSKFAPKLSLDLYAPLAAEPTPEGIRARAIRFLFRFASDPASALAAAELGSQSANIRREAAYSLSRRAYAPARERLELLLTESDVPTRAYAVAALGRIAAPESFSTLFTRLGDFHPWVRTNAAVALARVAAADGSKVRVDDLPRVIALSQDPDPGTRAVSVDLLGFYARVNETALGRLQTIARNGTRWERELAAAALARHFAAERPELLPEDLTEWAKVRVLEATAASPAGAALREKYSTDGNVMVLANVLANLPDKLSAGEIGIVRSALDHSDVIVRANALDALPKTGATIEEQLAIFRAADERERTSPLNDARLAALRGLASLDFAEREATLRALLSDNDPVVRKLAADSIVEKLGRPRPKYTPLPTGRSMDDYRAIAAWSRSPHTATIHLTRGTIDIKLLSVDAPMTAWNFAELARKKYFDGTTFMRVVPNFVVQGGDPRNDQNGGPGYAIRDEINLQKYTRGAVGMALSGPDTGGSQFFITHSPQPHLDGGYTIFGRVFKGMTGVVDQVERGDLVQTVTIDEREETETSAMDTAPRLLETAGGK